MCEMTCSKFCGSSVPIRTMASPARSPAFAAGRPGSTRSIVSEPVPTVMPMYPRASGSGFASGGTGARASNDRLPSRIAVSTVMVNSSPPGGRGLPPLIAEDVPECKGEPRDAAVSRLPLQNHLDVDVAVHVLIGVVPAHEPPPVSVEQRHQLVKRDLNYLRPDR